MISNESLVQRIKCGNSDPEDMQALYENNLPLIRKFIKPYTAYESMDDLLQESYFGLWEAVQHYESSENVLFMTYARFWIVQSVQRYLEKCGSTVRIPSHTRAKFTQIKKTIQRLEQEQGREPTANEIAALMGVSVEEVQEIQGYMQGVASLDTPLAEDNSLTLSDTLQADLSVENDVIEEIYKEHSENELWGIVEHFTSARENDIIKGIFIENQTMSAIAREKGISLDRVRQIKENGLRKLRIGKAKRELLEKFDIADSKMYRGTMENFREHGTSIVEYLAMQKLEALSRYQAHITEIEERLKKRII